MEALASVREGLSIANQSVSEGHLFAILMFACYAHLNADFKTWTMHMSAIHNIITSSTGDIARSNLEFIYLYEW